MKKVLNLILVLALSASANMYANYRQSDTSKRAYSYPVCATFDAAPVSFDAASSIESVLLLVPHYANLEDVWIASSTLNDVFIVNSGDVCKSMYLYAFTNKARSQLCVQWANLNKRRHTNLHY